MVFWASAILFSSACSLGTARTPTQSLLVSSAVWECASLGCSAAGLPSAEGWADTAGPGSPFVTGWKAGRHKASLLLWMNWATCWYPGVELGLGLPSRSLPGFFPLSCPLAEKANFSFFLPASLPPSLSSFLPPFLSFFFLPCLCYWWFWVVGLSMSQLGVGNEKKAQESHHIVVPQILSFSTQPIFFPSFRVLLSLSF